ncbi:hypothetical protein Vadar_009223 [Vaccinium darrowii]|uniref:Uncharacterized protein n=1 Tax=Vaccinium darrowii TaxID=229202 RepID=A0ACB7XPH6_9ERIC|nr:hypothetical protein Vadar_009223 [Vaccinium darrowii]
MASKYDRGSDEDDYRERERERRDRYGNGNGDRVSKRGRSGHDDSDGNGHRRREAEDDFKVKDRRDRKVVDDDDYDERDKRRRSERDGRNREDRREKGGHDDLELKGQRDREVDDDDGRNKRKRGERDDDDDDDDRDNRRRSERDGRSREDRREKGGHDDLEFKGQRDREVVDDDDYRNKRRRSEKDDGDDEDDRDNRRRSERDGRNREDRRQKGGRDDLEFKGQRDREVEDDDDRNKRRRSERDDGDRKHRRDKGGNEGREDGRSLKKSKEEKEGKVNEDQKMQNQSGFQGGNLNVEPVANLGRSGGVYIPPFKLARMMKEVEDKGSVEYQRLTWDALRKSINGLVNKVNATNIKNIIPELFAENLIRGRGLFCRSCMKSQMASPGFTDVFAALVAVVNTKFPEVGDLLLRRIILQLKRAYKRNDKPQLLAAVKFIAHLVNQQVVHELVALELLTLLLDKPTDDSVEVAVGFVTECGSILQDLCPRGLHGIFERFRGILHEGEIDKRVQFLIEGLFAIRKAKFQGYPAVRPELDLVELEDQLTHEISLQEEHMDAETTLDIFKADAQFIENEKRYEEVKKTILGDESEDEADSDAGSEDEDDEESDEEDEEQMKIKDETETNLVNLRRTIYLTIMSSVDFEEAGHKLLKIKLEPGQEMELCIMLLECCSQERTYLRYYGLLGQRFCMINKIHQENFEKCFVQQYSMIHRLETNKLRNVAKFFAHLLGTDALPWHVLAYIRLTEEDTTSSSRIFIKILFQELSEHLGIRLLNERLSDPTMQDSFESIFPKDNPKNTRFSINFFTSIGLGGITENLREYLKNMPRLIMQQQKPVSDDSGSSDDSESDASTAESDSESSSSESDDTRRKRKRRG